MDTNFRVNAMGDVEATIGGDPVDPDEWGWVRPGGDHDHPEWRRPLESLTEVEGFRVEVAPGPSAMPGPKRSGSTLEHPIEGHAPPAVLDYRDGSGARALLNRLSDAVGMASVVLANDASASPMLIHDLVGGRTIRVYYEP